MTRPARPLVLRAAQTATMIAVLGTAHTGWSQGLATPPPAKPDPAAVGAGITQHPSADHGDAIYANPDPAGHEPAAPTAWPATGPQSAGPDGTAPDGLPAFAAPLIAAARAQVGVTRLYDPAYVSLDFPGGDVPADRGVCTDVLIRALREGAHIDLQLAVNRDMKANFTAYPRNWGLKRTDANIDHRRVPNLATLFRRLGAEVPASTDPAAFRPGDVVTMMLPGNLPHILIVSDTRNAEGARPLVIHNIGRGTREEDALFAYPHTGHFRLEGDALAELRRLGQLEY